MERLGEIAGRYISVTHPLLILKFFGGLQSHSTT
jgi:hypothetical protein